MVTVAVILAAVMLVVVMLVVVFVSVVVHAIGGHASCSYSGGYCLAVVIFVAEVYIRQKNHCEGTCAIIGTFVWHFWTAKVQFSIIGIHQSLYISVSNQYMALNVH